jgi:glycosidase
MMFKKADWIYQTNVYEVNLRQYSADGTIGAFEKELPRLKDMGVDTLWFMPLTPISVKHRKGSLGSQYACSNYTAFSEEYGTLQQFTQFVKNAQQLGFKVIIDWVANHTGWDHVWTVEHPAYYKIDAATGDFKKASGMDDIIELDYTNPALRSAMIEAMRFWVTTCNIDGFRCDLAFWVQLDFWLEARAELEQTKVLFWLAECDPIDHPDYFKAFDACYTWAWMHKTAEFYKGSQDKWMLDPVLQQYNQLPATDNLFLWFTSNHDENTWNGTEYEKYGEAAAALAVFSCTWNGIPLVYSGQELPNKKRLAFFDKDVIEWTGTCALHQFYKTLLMLHRQHPALRAGDAAVQTFMINTNANDRLLAYLRTCGDQQVLVLLNLSPFTIDAVIEDDRVQGIYTDIFTGSQRQLQYGHYQQLQPWHYLLYVK